MLLPARVYSSPALMLRGARERAARGRVNRGPARAHGPPGQQAFKKAEGKTNLLRNPFKNIHALPCAPGGTAGKQELGSVPRGRREVAGVVLAAPCCSTSGCAEESWLRSPPTSLVRGRRLSSETCAEPDCMHASAGSTNVRLVCKKGTKNN